MFYNTFMVLRLFSGYISCFVGHSSDDTSRDQNNMCACAVYLCPYDVLSTLQDSQTKLYFR